jgi:hypothetical protein
MRGIVKVTYRQKRPAPDGHAQMGTATPHWARRLRLIAYALVVLVVGVAGTASAAALIGSKQVKDGSLTGHDVKLGTIRGSDVRDHSLEPKDFDVVPKGPPGRQGDPGDPGVNGIAGLAVTTVTRSIPANADTTIVVPCNTPATQKAIAGGTSGFPDLVELRQSAPAGDGFGTQGWAFVLRNRTGAQTVTVQAFCVTDR